MVMQAHARERVLAIDTPKRQAERRSAQRLASLEAVTGDHDVRIAVLEAQSATLKDISDTLNKIWKGAKFATPIVITAAVSSGVVSGKWGAFLHALVTGLI